MIEDGHSSENEQKLLFESIAGKIESNVGEPNHRPYKDQLPIGDFSRIEPV